jgi:hypothetical protein
MALSIALFLGVVLPLGLSFLFSKWGWTRLKTACQLVSIIMVNVNLAHGFLYSETRNIAGLFIVLGLLMWYGAGSSLYRGHARYQGNLVSREDSPFEFWSTVAALAAMGAICLVMGGLVMFLLGPLVATLREGG